MISTETRAVLSSVARIVFHGQRGSLAEHLERHAESNSVTRRVPPIKSRMPVAMPPASPRELEFFNGVGGFAAEGREYVITLETEQSTPAPWINVIANPQFGFQVSAADVYSVAPHVGRGGWTWYTGAAGWLYRAGLESILGCRQHGDRLLLDPCIPKSWPRFEISFKYRSARYEIIVENPDAVSHGITRTLLDGLEVSEMTRIDLLDDGATHLVHVTLG